MAAYLKRIDNRRAQTEGGEVLAKIPLDKAHTTIGNGGDQDVPLPWEGEKGYISIDLRADGYYLEPRGLPVYVNGCSVTLLARLKNQDFIRIGDVYTFGFISEEEEQKKQEAQKKQQASVTAATPNLPEAGQTMTGVRKSRLIHIVPRGDRKKADESGEHGSLPTPKEIAASFLRPDTLRLDVSKKPLVAKKLSPKAGDVPAVPVKPLAPIKPAKTPAPPVSPPTPPKPLPAVSQQLSASQSSAFDLGAPAQAEMTLVWDASSATIRRDQLAAELISPSNGQILSLKKDRILIGRLSTCDICLLDDYISREHLELKRTPLGFLLKNIGKNDVIVEKKGFHPATKNDTGTREEKIVLEEKIIRPNESTVLANEATIILGQQILYYFDIPKSQKSYLETSTQERKYNFHKHLTEQKQELLSASQLQKVLTPPCSIFDDLRVGVWFKYFAIGDLSGDFFLYHKKADALFLCLGDVSGHGASSALWASQISGMFKILAEDKDTPQDIVSCMNNHLTTSKKQKTVNMYSLISVVRVSANHVDLCIAGNSVPPLFYKARDNQLRTLDTPSTPMGMMTLAYFKTYCESLVFAPNDMLIIFTDGVTEAEMADGTRLEYGRAHKQIETQIAEKVECSQFLDTFVNWLDHTSEIQDDLSIVLIGNLGSKMPNETAGGPPAATAGN
jgi:pSer/pThr/pTyr-binding forkhead associated (FHA) protein